MAKRGAVVDGYGAVIRLVSLIATGNTVAFSSVNELISTKTQGSLLSEREKKKGATEQRDWRTCQTASGMITRRIIPGRTTLFLWLWVHVVKGGYIPFEEGIPPVELDSLVVPNYFDNGRTAEFHREQLEYGHDNDRNLQLVSPRDRPRTYQRLRIEFDTRPILAMRGRGDERDAEIERIVSRVLPLTASLWEQHLAVQRTRNGVPVFQETCFGLFEDVLDRDVIFPDADLVVLVNGEECEGGALAYASPCGFDQYDRPITGLMGFCFSSSIEPESVSATSYTGISVSAEIGRYTGAQFRGDHLGVSLVGIAQHEIAHILAVHDILHSLFRDEDGRPRTPRDSSGLPIRQPGTCFDGTTAVDRFAAESTVQLIPKQVGVGYDQYVVTPRVQRMARNHFNCPRLIGARLSDDANSCRGAHWHERHYFNHLLSPVASTSSPMSLSFLTLALMEDSGWYKVDYEGGTHPPFGILGGCGFVEEDCIQSQAPAPWSEGEFCNVPLARSSAGDGLSQLSLNGVFCDPGHESWNMCDLLVHRANDPPERRYFGDFNLAPLFERADSCPIPRIGLGLNCRIEDEYSGFYPGERVGSESRCINARYDRSPSTTSFQPACMRVACDAAARQVRIGQDENEHTCEFDGQELEIPGINGGRFVCPRLAILCPELFMCRNSCHGRGTCIYDGGSTPYCECDEGTTETDCAPPYIIQGDRVVFPADADPVILTPPSDSVGQIGTTPPSIETIPSSIRSVSCRHTTTLALFFIPVAWMLLA